MVAVEMASATAGSSFERVAALGFSQVILRVGSEDPVPRLEAAQQAGLSTLVRLGSIDAFIAGDHTKEEAPTPENGEFNMPTAVIRHPAFRAILAPAGSDAKSRVRSARVCAAARSAKIRCLRIEERVSDAGGLPAADGPAPMHGDALRPAIVEVLPGDFEIVPLWQSILGQYHRSLLDGQTDGLVVRGADAYFGGEAQAAPSQAPAVRAALAEACTRVNRWGALLSSSRLISTRPVDAEGDVRSAVFETSSRANFARPGDEPTRAARFVLIANLSDGFIRHEEVQVESDGIFERAVEVPSSIERPPGRIIPAHGVRFTVPIELRAGDALLFELF